MPSINTLLRGRDDPSLQDTYATSLALNLAFRLILCPVALLACWVPFRLLWKHGEFAACVFVATNWALVFFVFVNAIIWHSGDPTQWWSGSGWCDIQTYCQFAMTTVYSASVCAIMRRLAKQVGLLRVTDLSSAERRNRVLVQALIIFPVPVLQIALTILVQSHRYTLMPVNGCGKSYDGNIIYLIFFVLPSPVFTAAACFHAFQTYKRFREIRSTTREMLNSGNSTAASRSQRAKRKLYTMSLCILLPYAPVEFLFLVFNVLQGWPWTTPYDFRRLHYEASPPWGYVARLQYGDVGFEEMNMNWIPVITVFLIFVFFGTSKDAINTYREYLLAVGLGRVFPRLGEVYDPDRPRNKSSPSSFGSFGTHLSSPTQDTTAVSTASRKDSFVPLASQVSDLSGATISSTSDLHALAEAGLATRETSPAAAFRRPQQPARPALFNPTGLSWSAPPKLLKFPLPSIFTKKSGAKKAAAAVAPTELPLRAYGHHQSGRYTNLEVPCAPTPAIHLGGRDVQGLPARLAFASPLRMHTATWADAEVSLSPLTPLTPPAPAPAGSGTRSGGRRDPSSVRIDMYISRH